MRSRFLHFQCRRLLPALSVFFLLFFSWLPASVFSSEKQEPNRLFFSSEELEFIREHRGSRLTLALDPHAGIDYFEHRGTQYGYIHTILDLIRKETGLHIRISDQRNWAEALRDMQEGSVDILFGANATQERSCYLNFSKPIVSYPYAVFSRKNSDVRSLADFDGKHIAFIEGDVAAEEFRRKYEKIKANIILYPDFFSALDDLGNGKIDGFIYQGGPVVNRLLYDFPQIRLVTEIHFILSDMTFSASKKNPELLSIIEKVTDHYAEGLIAEAIAKAEIDFNRMALHLSEEEILWLDSHPVIRAGVTDNYLPFDYYSAGEYKGIAGSVLTKSCSLIGLEFETVHGDFSDLYQKALDSKVDILNMSKTDARMKDFLFTRPFSLEREIIYGRKDAPYVHDIYGLEGKRIAVVPGFWHYDSLEKNLLQPIFIEASSTEECLQLVHRGKADYFIENRTVAEYYITGLGYSSVMEKGVTGSDSFQYFAVRKDLPLLSSVLEKSMRLVSYDREKYNGLRSLPSITPPKYRNLILIIILLLVILSIAFLYIRHAIRTLAEQKANNRILRERTKILYMDPLTGVKNRAKFYESLSSLDEMPFPQAFVMIDINNLKKVNDNYGHPMGDELIRLCTEIIRSVYSTEFVFRMGGDEFLVIYFPKDPQQAFEDILRLNALSSKSCLTDGKTKISEVSMAVGCAFRDSSLESAEEVIKISDNLMYDNKKAMKKKIV